MRSPNFTPRSARPHPLAGGAGPFQEHRLSYEERGDGVPILLIPPAGGTASTWGALAEDLARVGRVILYDRRGYAGTGGEPGHSIPEHTADAAALLDRLGSRPTVVVGLSIGATIAIDLALRRPDLVRAVVAYESPWRATHHPSVSAFLALAKVRWLAWRGRPTDAVDAFMRWSYTYRNGGSAWDAFPPAWRQATTANARATLADIWIAIGDYPAARDLARIHTPVTCAYGTRSQPGLARIARSLTRAIPTARLREIAGSGHAVAFDAPAGLIQLVMEAIGSTEMPPDARGAGHPRGAAIR